MAFTVSSNRRTAMSEINVTPLVDVMLVLLIIFMVTAPMMQEGVSVELPPAIGAPIAKEHQQQEIMISVSGTGNVYVNDVPVKEDDLVQKILEAAKNDTSRQVYMRADKDVPYGVVVRIMGALKSAGIASLGMITTPLQKSAPTQ